MAEAEGDRSGSRALDPALAGLLRPVTILVGHFGSGKTEIAVNLALGLRGRGLGVTLVDLDLVKPYFRCRLAKDDLEALGVRLVAPAGDRFYADLPILLPEARAVARAGGEPERRTVFDVGGDDLGARVLGALAGLLDRNATDLLFVVNLNRPFAGDLPSLRRVLDAVQAAARLQVTGLVANTHLLHETTPETILAGVRAARALEAETGIPLRFSAMLAELAPAVREMARTEEVRPILELERHILPPFAARPRWPGRRAAVI